MCDTIPDYTRFRPFFNTLAQTCKQLCIFLPYETQHTKSNIKPRVRSRAKHPEGEVTGRVYREGILGT